jgi:hypothetical protein
LLEHHVDADIFRANDAIQRSFMIRGTRAMSMLVSSAGVLAVGLTAVGCGSSGSTASTASAVGGPSITKAEFVKKANAICAKGNAVDKAAGAKLGAQPSEKEITAFVKGTEAPAIQGQIDAIKALGAPAGDEKTVAKILGLAQGALEKVKIEPRIVSTGNDVFAAFAKVAHPYGLTACAPSS